MNLFWLRFAARTLLRRRARSGITLGAIALGVSALIFLGSLMVGINDAMIASSVALHSGNVLVRSEDALGMTARWRGRRDLPQAVSAALPRLTVPVMLLAGPKVAPVHLVGVVPAQEGPVTAIRARVEVGQYLADSPPAPQILLGKKTADTLGVSTGQQVQLRLAGARGPAAVVVGIFRTGIARFDDGTAYAHVDFVRSLNAAGQRGEVAVFLKRPLARRQAVALLRPILQPGEYATPWEELLPELEQLTQLNLASMAIGIALVVVIMAAGVSNTVLVSVMDRYREFGVLKALGTTPGEILRLIVAETALLCATAGAVGLALGAAATGIFGRAGIDISRFTSENPHFVLTSVVHPRLTWTMAVAPARAALAAGILVSLWPGLAAARRRAADVMRLSR